MRATTGFRRCAARELEEESGIALPADEELVLFARWITPEPVKRRFDAWFFLALAPAHTPPKADGVETVDAGWFRPQDALDAHKEGELALVFPTIRQLESLLPYRTSEEALEGSRGREVTPILPKVDRHQRRAAGRLAGGPRLPGLSLSSRTEPGPPGNGSSPACHGPAG